MQRDHPPTSPSGAGGLGLLVTAIFMSALDTRALVSLLPAIADDLGETVATTGLIITAYSLPFALFQLVYGPLGDRIGPLRVIAGAFGLFAIGTGLSGLAPSLPLLLVIRALTGAVAAAVFPLSLAYVGNSVPYERRASAIGMLNSTSSAAQVLSVSIGGMVGAFLEWRLLYLLFSVLAAVTWVFLFRAARRTPRPAAPPAELPAGTFLDRLVGRYLRIYRVSGAALVYGLVIWETTFLWGGFTFVGAALHDRFEVSLLLVGFALTGFGIGAFAAGRTVGPLIRRLGERRLFLVGGLLAGAGFALTLVVPRWEVGFLATLLMGLGFSCSHVVLQTIVTELAPSARGTALGLHAFHAMAGQAIGAAVLGALLAATGYDLILALCAAGLALLSVIGVRILPARPAPRVRAIAVER